MKYEECPNCGNELRTVLTNNRFNNQYCEHCCWTGESFTPETKKITAKRKTSDYLSGCYQIFDKYGQVIITSRRYYKDEECRNDLIKELEHCNRQYTPEKGGPCIGVVWPATIEIVGEIVGDIV